MSALQTPDSYLLSRYSPDPHRRQVWEVLAEYLQRFVSPQSAVLDLGAGYCDFINQIRARERHAYDCSEEMRRFAAPGVQVHVAAALSEVGLREASLDFVFASNFFEHLDSEAAARTLRECRRLLRPQGQLLILQPNFRYSYKVYFDDYTHRAVYTHESLKDFLLVHGFKVLWMKKRFLPFTFKSGLPTWPFLTRLYLWCPYKPWAGQMLLLAARE